MTNFQTQNKELQNWIENAVYKEVSNVGQEFVTVRWVLTEKENGTKKARLVARGFQEDTSKFLVDSPTCSKEIRRVFLCILTHFQWLLHSLDVKTAFLQGKQINRDVFLKPPPEAATKNLWKLQKCVYGLGDAARKWYDKLLSFFVENGLLQSKLDKAFFFLESKDGLEGAICIHVDDMLYGGTQRFHEEIMTKFKERFTVGRQEVSNFTHLGVFMRQDIARDVQISQSGYIDTLLENYVLTDETKLKAIMGKLEWIACQTRPYICFRVNQVREKFSSSQDDANAVLNKLLRTLKFTRAEYVKFNRLGSIESWKMIVFADASFANRQKCATQGGYFIFIMDGRKRVCPIEWRSKKVPRVVHSTLAAETLALSMAIDAALFLQAQIHEILKISLPICCYTDSKSLYCALSSTKPVLEKRLRINIASITETLEKGEIESVKWIETGHQLANSLTKPMSSDNVLQKVLQNGEIHFPLPN